VQRWHPKDLNLDFSVRHFGVDYVCLWSGTTKQAPCGSMNHGGGKRRPAIRTLGQYRDSVVSHSPMVILAIIRPGLREAVVPQCPLAPVKIQMRSPAKKLPALRANRELDAGHLGVIKGQ